MKIHSELEDDQLIAFLRRDDKKALASIYNKYWKQLYLLAYGILKDSQTCEDAVQEVFIRFWNGRQSLNIHTSLKAYLFSSVRYEIIRQIKIKKLYETTYSIIAESNGIVESNSSNIEYLELQLKVNSLVEQLPSKCRTVYKMSREQHLSHKQIAAQLNISPKTVENHINKALNHLRLALSHLPGTLVFLSFIKNIFR